MRNLTPTWDGDEGPVYQFRIRNGSSALDTSIAAVEFYIYDQYGTFVARRAGLPMSPKSSGVVNLMLLGRETDWDGAGRTLILKPKVYAAVNSDGLPSSNLLINPSFDTASGSLPARIATGWNLGGARTAIWDSYANDAFPPTIFGNFQLVNHPTISDPDYIQQGPSVSLAAGDRLSVGCWHRFHAPEGTQVAGGVKNDNHGIFFRCGSQQNSHVQFEIVTSDWYFASGSVVTPTAETVAVMGIDGRGTTGSNRYDEAFCFVGEWLTPTIEPMRIVVKPRSRVVKTENQVAGIGGFEQDSNGDGLADSWAKYGSVNTFSMERNPQNVSEGFSSQKVVLNNASVDNIFISRRGRFQWGETWEASVMVKTNGPLSGSGGGSGFGIQLQTQYFDGGPPILDSKLFDPDLPAFTKFSTLITMPEDRKELLILIFLCGYTGTAWIDDVQLKRIDG
jgi:hypothetical protein